MSHERDTSGNAGVERAIGRLESQTDSHAERLERIEDKLDHVVAAIDQAKGGWKSMVAVGGLASALTVGISEVVSFLSGAHK